MKLCILPQELAVVHFSPSTPIPEWVWGSSFYSITRTPSELSIFCDSAVIPDDVEATHGWRAFHVDGQIPFDLPGVLAALSMPLATKQISIFSISTFDTDYMVVPENRFEEAVDILQRAGHEFRHA